jgi:hypothetical protein
MPQLEENFVEQLREQEAKKSAILHDLGVLETQKHNLLHAFANVQEEQNKLKVEIEDKHGKINVNLEDGSFEEIEGEE